MILSICLATAEPEVVPLALDRLDDPQPCQEQQVALEQIEAKYADDLKKLEEDGEALEDEDHPGHHVAFEVKFKLQRWRFDVPNITMRPKEMILNLPQVSMRQQTVAWKMPVTVMRRVGTRINPRVTCRRVRLIPPKIDCKTEWDMVYTDVPSVEYKRFEISTKIPEVRYARTSVVTNIPQVRMSSVEFSTKIPEFTMESPIPETGPVEAKGKELQQRGDAIAERINQDVAERTASLYTCLIGDLQVKRATAANQFTTGIDLISASINALQAQGADPSAVEIDGKIEDLFKLREKLVSEQKAVLASFDDSIAEMLAATRGKVDEIVGSTETIA